MPNALGKSPEIEVGTDGNDWVDVMDQQQQCLEVRFVVQFGLVGSRGLMHASGEANQQHGCDHVTRLIMLAWPPNIWN